MNARSASDWPAGDGNIERLIRNSDWPGSPLGEPRQWPQALRSLVEIMLRAKAQLVLFWGPEFVALYNDAYAPTIGIKHPRAFGRPARENWSELWDDLGPLLRGVRETGITFSAKDRSFYIERHGYPETVYFDVSYSAVPEADGSTGGVLCIVSETTERKRAELALRESEDRYRQLAEAMPLIIWQLDAGGLVQYVNDKWSELTGRPASDAIGLKWLFTTLPGDQAVLDAAWEKAERTGGIYEAEYRVALPSGTVRWFFSRGVPIKTYDGAILRWVGSDMDITDLKRAEESTRFLMREVNHRSKNLLAVVQAIAKQTASEVDPAAFSARFGERLQGLAATQDILVRNEWKGADLGQIIRSQLGHFEDLLDSRIVLDGPPVNVTSAAAQNLGLALHELATNAGKYGALTSQSGEIAVTWMIDRDRNEPLLTLEWKEANGPTVVPPTRRGLGSLLITRIAEQSLSAKVHVDYAPSGLVWRLAAPLNSISA